MLTIASELIGGVKTGGSLGCSDHPLSEFIALMDMGNVRSIVRTLNFRKANFPLFQVLVSRTPRERVLRDRWTEQSWQIFKDAFHRAQELSVPRRQGREETWLS